MSHLDNMTLANKKNVVGKTRLAAELNRITREQLIEMRMHNNTKQRFKNKYAKLDVFDESRGREASDVIMYETHNPGFCYRRNGDCRVQQSFIIKSSVDMQDLHMMLFTKGEIDIDKVLCLYLLAVHKSETLRLPPKSQRISFLRRQQSPLERLVDRSKKKSSCFDNKLHNDMPLYVLEVRTVIPKKEPYEDPRLACKIIVNNKILQIVDSVRNALETSNPALLAQLVETTKDKLKIQNIMQQQKMQTFIQTLYGQNIISSCESFQLETPVKDRIDDLELQIPALDNLIQTIRKNVLLIPNTNMWKFEVKKTEAKEAAQAELVENEIIEKEVVINEINPPSSYYILPSQSDRLTDEEFKLPDETEIDAVCSSEEDKVLTKPIFQPKIMKNLQLGFSNVKTESVSSAKAVKQAEMSLEELANLLSKKVRKEAKQEYRNMMYDTSPRNTNSMLGATTSEHICHHKQRHSSSYSLTQTKCDACLHKWQLPLPAPKISKLKKLEMPILKDTSYFSSKSAQKISKMIDDKVKNIEAEQLVASTSAHLKNRVSSDGKLLFGPRLSNRMYKEMAKGHFSVSPSIEIVDLDELELAKIRQEIKVTETKKKLLLFLEE